MALLVAGFVASSAWSEVLEGRVVGITDGDTFALLVDRQTYKVRIAEIDTPERGEPWAEKSKRALSELIFGKSVSVDVSGLSYGRSVGEFWLGDQCVGCALVRAGHAWAADGYVKHQSLYRLEEEARIARRGLWSMPEGTWMAPSRQREQQGSGGRARGPLDRDPPDAEKFACGGKQYCREMSSCAEARFYLQRCGLTALDGDSDGVPCEDRCR